MTTRMTTHMTRRETRWAALAAAGTLVLAGCGAVGSADGAASSQPSSEAASTPTAEADKTGSASAEGGGKSSSGDTSKSRRQAPTDTHVARTASLSMTVKDIERASAKVRSATDRAGGCVSSEESRIAPDEEAGTTDSSSGRGAGSAAEPQRSDRSWAEITVTVPVDELDSTLTTLSEVGEVTQRTTDAEDLSSEYTDTAARVRTKKKSIARLQKLISSTEDLDQIVTLEDELAQREADLESMTSQQKTLEKRTTTAPITVSLASTEVAEERESPAQAGFVTGLSKGWTGFTSALEVGLTALGTVTPFAVTGLVIVGPFVWWVRRRMHRPLPAPVATTTE